METRSESFGRNFQLICIAILSGLILTQIRSIYYANLKRKKKQKNKRNERFMAAIFEGCVYLVILNRREWCW